MCISQRRFQARVIGSGDGMGAQMTHQVNHGTAGQAEAQMAPPPRLFFFPLGMNREVNIAPGATTSHLQSQE